MNNKLKILIIVLILSLFVIGFIVFNQIKHNKIRIKNIFNTTVKIQKQSAKIKSYHLLIEIKEKDKIIRSVDADVQLPGNSQGILKLVEDGNDVTRGFKIIDSIVYIKQENVFDNKYVIWSQESYPELALIVPKNMADLIPTSSKWQKEGENINATIDIETYLSNPGIISTLPSQIVVNQKTKEILKISIGAGENTGGLTKTITFSDYNKPIDIQVPKEDELAK